MDPIFASDNVMGLHPEALVHMVDANGGASLAYGSDMRSAEARVAIQTLFGSDVPVFFVFNGGAANALALASLTRSFEAIVCHKFAHADLDECSAPEFFTGGSKLIPVEGDDGKVTVPALEAAVLGRDDVHYPRVRTLTLTQSTEVGTVYSLSELNALRTAKEKHGLKLHMDGARFAQAIASLGCEPRAIIEAAGVDVLSLGLVKCGVSLVEALVFLDADAADGFNYRQKQACQLGSKLRLGTAPIGPIVRAGRWLDWAGHANVMAQQLANGLSARGLSPAFPVQANGVFVRFPQNVLEALRSHGWEFYDFVADTQRLMCHWATTEETVERFLADVTASL